MRVLIPLYLVILSLLQETAGYGQYTRINEQYSLNRYNTENGSLQNSVNAIAQDEQGYIWLASQAGLIKWDGANFLLINKTTDNKASITGVIDLLKQEYTDSIYCITQSDKIYLITKGKIQHLPLKRQADESEEAACYRFSILKDKRLSFDRNPAEAYVLRYQNNNNYIYYINQNKVYESTIGTNLHFTPIKFLDTIYFQDNHLQWYAQFRNSRKKVTITLKGDILKNATHKKSIITVVGRNNTHIVLSGNSFYAVQKAGNCFYTRLISNSHIPAMTSSFYDSSSRQLLFGTIGSGLYVFKKNQFLSIADNSNRPLNSYHVKSFSQLLLNSNTILSNFRFAYNLQTKKVFIHPFKYVKSIHQLSDSTIWCETDDKNQLKQFTKDLNLIKIYKKNGHLKKRHPITGIIELTRRKILFSSMDGIFSIDDNDSLVREQSIDQSQIGKLGVECMKLVNDSTLWIGTKSGIFEHKINQRKTTLLNGSNTLYVRELKVDRVTNTIWISTYGQGPYCFRNNCFRALPLDKNNYLTHTHFFAEDNKGRFWIATNNGLFEIAKQKLLDYADGKINAVFYYYWNNQDGFLTNEFNGGPYNNYIKTKDNFFSFPTIDGIVIFNPDSIKHINTKYPVSITDITVDEKEVLHNESRLTVTSAFKTIKLAISIAYYGNRNNLTIKYRIPSYNDNWYTVAPDNKIVVSQLPPGEHPIQIKVISGFNRTEKITDFLHLTVLPRWHETILFRVIIVAIVCFLILLLVKRKVQKTEQMNLELKRMVAEKTTELVNTIQDLEKSLEENELILLALSHDVLGPLNFSLLTSQDLLSQWETIPDTRKKRATTILSSTLQKMSFFVSDFLTWISFDSKGDVILLEFNVLDFLKSISSRHISHNNQIELNCPKNLTIRTNKRILEIIIGNIFQNAVKFTKKGIISLSAYKRGAQIVISCKDSGQGMTDEQIQTLLTSTSIKGADYTKSFGLGYRIIRFFLPKINATILIHSKQGNGTEVQVFIDAVP